MNEGKNIEDSQIILKSWPIRYYSDQGHGKVSNIGGAPIMLNQRFERVEILVVKNYLCRNFLKCPPVFTLLRKDMGRGCAQVPPSSVPTALRKDDFEKFQDFSRNSRKFSKFEVKMRAEYVSRIYRG